jgi:hypothetical protein
VKSEAQIGIDAKAAKEKEGKEILQISHGFLANRINPCLFYELNDIAAFTDRQIPSFFYREN